MKHTFEEIKQMGKREYMNKIKRKITYKTLNDLNEMKSKHSKVKELEHLTLKMQDYLLPNKSNMKNEEAELIFQLRCRTTRTKMNMKGMFDSYECRACGESNETQIHVIQCKTLQDMNKEDVEKLQYEKLYGNDVEEQNMQRDQVTRQGSSLSL